MSLSSNDEKYTKVTVSGASETVKPPLDPVGIAATSVASKENDIQVIDAPAVHSELTITLTDIASPNYVMFHKYLTLRNKSDTSVYLPGAKIVMRGESIGVTLQHASPLNVIFDEIKKSKVAPIAEWKPLPWQKDVKEGKQNASMPLVEVSKACAEEVKNESPEMKALQEKAEKWRVKYWDDALRVMKLAIKDDNFKNVFNMILGPELYRVRKELTNELHHSYFDTKESEVTSGFYNVAYAVAEIYENKIYYEEVWLEYENTIINKIPDQISRLNEAIRWLNDFGLKTDAKIVEHNIKYCQSRIVYYNNTVKNFTDLKNEYYNIYQAFEKKPDMVNHQVRLERIDNWVSDCVRKMPDLKVKPIELNAAQKAEFDILLDNSLTFIIKDTIDQLTTQYMETTKVLGIQQGLTPKQLKANLVDPMLVKHEDALKMLKENFLSDKMVRNFNKDNNISSLKRDLFQFKQPFVDEYNLKFSNQQNIQNKISSEMEKVAEKFQKDMCEWLNKNKFKDAHINDAMKEIIYLEIGSVPLSIVKDPQTGNTLLHELMKHYKVSYDQDEKRRILDLAEILYAHGADPYALNKQQKCACENAQVYLNMISDFRLMALELKYAMTYSPFAEWARKKLENYCDNIDKANFFKRLLRDNEVLLKQRLLKIQSLCKDLFQSTKKIDDHSLVLKFREIVSASKNKHWQMGYFGSSLLNIAVSGIQELEERRLIEIGPNYEYQLKEQSDKLAKLEADYLEMRNRNKEMENRVDAIVAMMAQHHPAPAVPADAVVTAAGSNASSAAVFFKPVDSKAVNVPAPKAVDVKLIGSASIIK